MSVDLEHLRDWIGRSETREALVTPWQADVLAATLDRDERYREGDALPPAWHWMYFPEVVQLAATGPDGHPVKGGFLPPVPLPRRMWAGVRVRMNGLVHVGDRVTRTTTITDLTVKEGRSGTLCFLKQRHEVAGAGGTAIVEDYDTVYREAPAPDAKPPQPPAAPADGPWSREVTPTPVLLFRYSALTMNSHRIHYDRPYATGVEAYPGLVVHGPLTATLLLDLFRRALPQARMTHAELRALSPQFDDAPLRLGGTTGESPGTARLWAANAAGELAMTLDCRYI